MTAVGQENSSDPERTRVSPAAQVGSQGVAAGRPGSRRAAVRRDGEPRAYHGWAADRCADLRPTVRGRRGGLFGNFRYITDEVSNGGKHLAHSRSMTGQVRKATPASRQPPAACRLPRTAEDSPVPEDLPPGRGVDLPAKETLPRSFRVAEVSAPPVPAGTVLRPACPARRCRTGCGHAALPA